MKKKVFHIYGLLVLVVIFCAPLPTDNEVEKHTMRLSLEKTDRDSAVFSGEPIHAIVETGDSTLFSSLAWHTGMGRITIPIDMINKYDKQFDVYLYWRSYPAKKDLETKTYYDTVFVSIGGSLRESNKTVVKVTNLPVIVDSILVADTIMSGEDKFWKYQIYDSSKTVKILFYARDFDGKIPDITYSGNKGKIIQSTVNPLQMTYEVSSGRTNDTIHFLVFDHMGAKLYYDLNIKPYKPNSPPVIDSIEFQDTILKGANLYHVGFASFDTLKIVAYIHDPEGTDVNCKWKAYASTRIQENDLFNNEINYVCTSGVCKQVHKDTSILVDTIKLVVTDENGDSSVAKIEIVKGNINYPPFIEEITINDSLFEKPDSIISFPIEYSGAYQIIIKTADPDSDSVKVMWTGIPQSQLTMSTDSGVTFTASEAQISDTLIITASDKKSQVISRILFLSPSDR